MPAAASTITTRLQSLSHRQFLDFLSPLFTALMDPIYRAASVRALLSSTLASIERELDVTAALTGGAGSAADPRLLASLASKKAEYQSNLASFNELLASSSEYLYLRMAKLLHTRAALHAVLPLSDFRELLDVVLSFLQQSEAMCARPFYGMRGALLAQAKAFVGNFHARCMRELVDGLEKEKWTRVDVDVDYQTLLDASFVLSGDGHAPLSLARRKEEREADDDRRGEHSVKPMAAEEQKRESRHSSGRAERKVLFVPAPKAAPSSAPSSASSPASSSNFLKFPVVRSVLLLLELISHYVDLSSHLPALTLDTLHRLLELLRLFNSRTGQLVLGAGAMHLAGLRSITATHLALSSQAISLLATQIPRLKAVFEQRLAAKHRLFLQGFDRVRRDCEEHVEQIREKLVHIMRDLIDASLRKMAAAVQQQLRQSHTQPFPSAPSSAPPPTASADARDADSDDDDDVVSAATRLLMKQTCSLHRALTDLLSGRERALIFRDIGGALVGGFMAACTRLEADASVGGKGSTERLRMLLQANGLHILMRMKTLTGVDEDVVLQLKEFIEQLRGSAASER